MLLSLTLPDSKDAECVLDCVSTCLLSVILGAGCPLAQLRPSPPGSLRGAVGRHAGRSSVHPGDPQDLGRVCSISRPLHPLDFFFPRFASHRLPIDRTLTAPDGISKVWLGCYLFFRSSYPQVQVFPSICMSPPAQKSCHKSRPQIRPMSGLVFATQVHDAVRCQPGQEVGGQVASVVCALRCHRAFESSAGPHQSV